MFDEMTASIQEDTIRLLYHVKIEQKVEREQVAKVTGTNKDESAYEHAEEACCGKGISERSVSVRKRQEVQAVLRQKRSAVGVLQTADCNDGRTAERCLSGRKVDRTA